MRLAIVTPIGRESSTLSDFLKELENEVSRGFVHFLVTDSYTDSESLKIVKNFAGKEYWKHVTAPEGGGIAGVYIAGHLAALESGADLILEIDAGFSHKPEEIPRFLEAAEKFDVVLGYRSNVPGVSSFKSTPFRRMISWAGTSTVWLVLGIRLKDATSGFQLFHREALQKILGTPLVSKGPFFQTEMKARCFHLNLKVGEVPISYSNPSRRIRFSDISDAVGSLMKVRKQVIRDA
jgi:dolichol-phosphate mannosyltransferase